MAVMSTVLLLGKGSGLIAGYNTASNKTKAKYDEVKLCRVMGSGLLVLTITLAFSLWNNFKFSNVFTEYAVIAIMGLTIISIIILANTICKKI
jgi:hypothetical protein